MFQLPPPKRKHPSHPCPIRGRSARLRWSTPDLPPDLNECTVLQRGSRAVFLSFLRMATDGFTPGWTASKWTLPQRFSSSGSSLQLQWILYQPLNLQVASGTACVFLGVE